MTAKAAKRLPGPLRRRHLLEAARETFLRHGRDGARTRQIAETAGVPEALLYHYFGSKEELFEAAILEPLQTMVEQLEGLLVEAFADDSLSPEETVRAGLRSLLGAMREVLPSLGMVLHSNESYGRQFYLDHFEPLMVRSQAIASQYLARLTDQPLDPIFATAIYGSGMNFALDSWLRGEDIDLDDLADRFTRLVLYGAVGAVLTPAAAPRSSGRTKR